jgi:hypothetical protein
VSQSWKYRRDINEDGVAGDMKWRVDENEDNKSGENVDPEWEVHSSLHLPPLPLHLLLLAQ